MAVVERCEAKADIWAILSAIKKSDPMVPAFRIATRRRDPSAGDLKLVTECLSLSVRSQELGVRSKTISVGASEAKEVI